MAKSTFGLTNNQLKILAMVALVVDAFGRLLLPQYAVFPIIGRLAYPILAYMFAEDCVHTKGRGWRLLLLFGVGLACQTMTYFVTGSLKLNILLTFALAVVVIYAMDYSKKSKGLLAWLLMLCAVVAVAAVCVILPDKIGHGFAVDFGLIGVATPVIVYHAPKKSGKLITLALLLVVMAYSMGGIQWYALLGLLPLMLYSGALGNASLQYLFYILFPTHLAMLYLVRWLMR